MKILVTGANGYLGARLYKDLSKKFETFGTYHNSKLFPELKKLDMASEEDVFSVVKQTAPNVIVHTAAIPTAQKAKENGEKTTLDINVNGTKRIVNAATEVNAKIIYISTGAADTPTEFYSFSKKEAEHVIKSSKLEYLILRPSMVIGQSPNTTNDRFQNRLLKNIAGILPAKYENSALFRTTWIGHISEVIEELLKRGTSNETIAILSEEKKTRYEIANDILKEFKIECIPFIEQSKPAEFTTTADKLKELRLPLYSYNQIIEKTVYEIKEYLNNRKTDA